MNRDQTIDLISAVRVLWPHSNLGPDAELTVAMWTKMLQDVGAEDAELAVREMASRGREHAPPVGVIVYAVTQRLSNMPEWDEVREEILRAIRRYRPPRDVAFSNPYAAPPEGYWSHPIIARFVEHLWDEWRMAPDPEVAEVASDARTFYAQQRDAFKALRARTERDAGLVLVGAPREGRGELRRLPVPELNGGPE